MKRSMTVAVLLLLAGFSLMAQPSLVVLVDTFVTVGHQVEWGDYAFSGYDEWHWSRSNPYPSILFEDDLYTVSQDNIYGDGDVLFTAKHPSLYIDAHNGWPQYEYVNRQYYFTGEFHQILRHGDYYYFINPKRVDSLRIDQSPGNPLVKNILPSIWDEYPLGHGDARWCDPISGYGAGWLCKGYICGGCCIESHLYYMMPTNTLFHGAFVADDQLLYLVSRDNEVFIAQKNGNDLTRVKELGKGWNFYDFFGDPRRWWNLGPGDNRLILPFSTTEGFAGLLTIDGSFIHVRYVMSPKTVVP